MNDFLKKLNQYNLCTWYILPLIDLNVDSFGRAAMINSYLVKDKMQIVVQVVDRNLCHAVQIHKYYRGWYEKEESDFLIFEIPQGWASDIQNYLNGSYSKFGYFTKCKIREKSGLKYEVPDGKGQKISDAILLALDRHDVLRSKWFEILGNDVELPDELLSKPKPESFLDEVKF